MRFGQDPGASARCYLALTHWFSGFPDRASAVAAAAEALAQRLRHANTLAYVHFHAALLAMMARDADSVIRHLSSLEALATEHRLGMWKASATNCEGWILGLQGRLADGAALLRRGLADVLKVGSRLFRPLGFAELAKIQMAAGLTAEAKAAVDAAFLELEETAQRVFEPEACRIHGEWLLQCGRQPDAEAWFERALAVARTQQAKLWELRAATSLARLRAEQGQPRRAHDVLAPIYTWFTEGFDTLDLKEAKALLDNLR